MSNTKPLILFLNPYTDALVNILIFYAEANLLWLLLAFMYQFKHVTISIKVNFFKIAFIEKLIYRLSLYTFIVQY